MGGVVYRSGGVDYGHLGGLSIRGKTRIPPVARVVLKVQHRVKLMMRALVRLSGRARVRSARVRSMSRGCHISRMRPLTIS